MRHRLMVALAITVIASLNATSLWAEDYDDIYYNSSSKSKTSTAEDNEETKYETAKYYQEERDVDEYNRRYTSYDSDYESGYYYDDEVDSIATEDEDFEYTERVRRFYNPKVILESEDDEAVELYEDTRTDVNIIVTTPYYRGWAWCYDPWLWDDYYYYTDLWYYPWYRSYWYYPAWTYWGWGWTWGHHHHHYYANAGWIGGHHHNGHGGRSIAGRTGSATRGSGVRSSHAGASSRYASTRGSRSAELAGRHTTSGSGYSRSSASRYGSSAGTRSSSGYSGSRGSSGGSRSSGGFSGGGSRGGGGGSHGGGGRR